MGEDGQIGDPTDEDEDLNTDEPSIGEGNGLPDCGEPNVDDLEEITELSGEIHEGNCDLVQISNGGHWCLDENPKEVILHLDNFINSLS